MATMEEEQAAVTVPAADLEDVRCALVEEIKMDTDALASNQAELLADDCVSLRVDRASAVGILRRDLQLLDQLIDMTGATTLHVHGEQHTLARVFDAIVRVQSGRLKDVCRYGPLPVGDVVELSTRLHWAADEAIRLCPDLDNRLSETA